MILSATGLEKRLSQNLKENDEDYQKKQVVDDEEEEDNELEEYEEEEEGEDYIMDYYASDNDESVDGNEPTF